MAYRIGLIEGDGIGHEVTHAAVRVLEATGLDIEWVPLKAGEGALRETGEVLPQETLDQIKELKLALKGPVTTPIGYGFKSVNVQIRQKLDLYAAIRPVRKLQGINTRYDDVDIIVVRENTEGLYAGIENDIADGVVVSLKVVTQKASERIAKAAFDYARLRDRKKVTVFHKANILKRSDGLFMECARKVHREYAPELELDELLIDNGCMQLVRNPERFDVLLMQNLYGDLISDLCAGLVGGLGVVPGANIGSDIAVFEAVHGSAPDIAGQRKANPLALIMSGAMMVRYLGEVDAHALLRKGYETVLREGRKEELTYDLGGTATTDEFADALIKRMQQ